MRLRDRAARRELPLNVIRLTVVLLPWRLKRLALQVLFGFELHPTSYIGLSWVYPRRHLKLGPHSRIMHGTVCRMLDDIELAPHSQIGAFNWITGLSADVSSPFFDGEKDRRSALSIGAHSTITARHYIDCTNAVSVGAFTAVGGVRSVLITHEVDVRLGSQVSRPIVVGDYCLLGTGCTLLPGAVVPDRSVVGAGSLVTGVLEHAGRVYVGTPARAVAELPVDAPYFTRPRGIVE